MPPAPISRSSTYLPKIWGNIACRRVLWVCLGLTGLSCASDEPELLTRTVRVYSLQACPAPDSGELELVALGPFSATNSTAEVLPLESGARELRFPIETRAIAATARAESQSFIGLGEARGDDVELVLWPEAESCAVFDDALVAGFPSAGGGQALGFSASRGLLLAAGGNDPQSSAVVGALTFDLGRGQVYAVDAAARHVLGEPRAFATVSEFGSKLLVAGGEDPIHDVPEELRAIHDSAEVYDPETQRFELELLALREQRTRHASLLLDSGETLLVGGRGAFGSALALLEAVSPETRSSNLGKLQPLAHGRIEPVALRLSDRRIFVGGGYDAESHPVQALEWLSPDASSSELVLEAALPPRYDRAFVPMPGGALLAVGGCEERSASSSDEVMLCASLCRRGCPPAAGEAFWIAADGSVAPVALGALAPRPLLLPGSDGSPWLFVARESGGVLDPAHSDAFRFNPFRAVFEAVEGDLGELPSGLLPLPVAVAPDHFFWISADSLPKVRGFRGDTRSALSRDVALVSASHPTDPSWPLHLAPDRDPAGRLSYDGSLHLLGEPLTVYVADALYEEVLVELEVDGPPPLVLFGEGAAAAACSFPEGEPARETLRVRRDGAGTTLTRGSLLRTCTVPAGSLALGLSAPGASTTLLSLTVERL